tara:strand:- start:56 stop:418 length:363 start_codon:yes stop_codon:yes gene_type:complete
MNTRQKIIIVVGIGVVVLAGISAPIFYGVYSQQQNGDQSTVQQESADADVLRESGYEALADNNIAAARTYFQEARELYFSAGIMDKVDEMDMQISQAETTPSIEVSGDNDGEYPEYLVSD